MTPRLRDEAMTPERKNRGDDRIVTVCDACLRAGCWHGIFYCDDYQTAGTVDLPVSELRRLDREHPSYYSEGEVRRVWG